MVKKIFTFLFITVCAFSLSAQEATKDWYHKTPEDGFNGVGADKTYEELLKGRASVPVVVAVIDSGIDIEHEDLKDNIWVNPGEIPDNNVDDDGNGYVDDVNGWNFIGGPDGKNVGADSYEVTRVYNKLKYKYENASPDKLTKKQKEEYKLYLKTKEEVMDQRESAEKGIARMDEIKVSIMEALDIIDEALDGKKLTRENVAAVEVEDEEKIAMTKRVLNNFLPEDEVVTMDEIKEQLKEALSQDKKRYQDRLDYAYNPEFDTRQIIGDDYSNSRERIYGNNDVEGPDALHGTHVGGIIGAVRGNDIGMNGIANNVKLMSIRTVPDGDERDKDVANAIRYAVDNGASIINMSFGKGYSWDKDVVDDAVKYAEKNDVLLVHAAGNAAQNNDSADNFPNDKYDKKGGFFLFRIFKSGHAKNWIEVGALSYKKDEKMPATFSNYGKENVDVFAPGVKIYAPLPDDEYAFLQGTSMASPVVAGIAAVLRSYFPALSARQVKDIILSTATPHEIKVVKPGTKDELVNFEDLSVTGGVVDMYKAVQKAMTTKGKKKVKRNKGA